MGDVVTPQQQPPQPPPENTIAKLYDEAKATAGTVLDAITDAYSAEIRRVHRVLAEVTAQRDQARREASARIRPAVVTDPTIMALLGALAVRAGGRVVIPRGSIEARGPRAETSWWYDVDRDEYVVTAEPGDLSRPQPDTREEIVPAELVDDGVWVHYGINEDLEARSLHPDELSALRAHADDQGSVGGATLIPYGVDIADHLRAIYHRGAPTEGTD